MAVRDIARKQYRALVDAGARALRTVPPVPREGWVASVRKALGMTGPDLARRLDISRARVQQIERAELDEGATLRTLHRAAEAMGCRFVYAIVPEGDIQNVMHRQARKKASALVERAGGHMALEDQALSPAMQEEKIQALTDEFLASPGRDFWIDE